MDPQNMGTTCACCKYFYRHYVRTGNNRYDPLKTGHCSEPRCRDKAEDTAACHRFSPAKRAK